MSRNKSTTGGQHSFAQIPRAEIQRSTFDRSCGLKTTFDSGYLVPIFVDEALPGDTMSLRVSTFARMATPLHPIMDNIYQDMHFFSIPIRLIWDNWQKFNGEQTDPGDSTTFLIPEMDSGSGSGYEIGSLSDYLGLPTGIPDLVHSSLFHRAYNLVYNEWYRSEDLIDSAVVDKDDTPDNPADYVLRRRGKRHDYFTSALPWPQKGTAVSLPLGISAPVSITGITPARAPIFAIDGTDRVLGGSGSTDVLWSGSTTAAQDAKWSDPGLEGVADLSTATAATINELREAMQIQRLYERDARGGTRYTEILRSHFGVTSPDARLQRPEYLGGDSTRININPVAQTAQGFDSGTSGTVQGNLAAFATASSTGRGFTKSFTEHCLIIGLISVRADLNYQQGLNRMFSRSTRWDFYWPALAHLGEMAILNKEIFAQGSNAPGVDDQVFGYQERYAEYRYKPSQITGQMRSQAPQSLDTWHLAQDFATLPTLSESFINEVPVLARAQAVTAEPEFLLDAFFSYRCARPMPTYSVPGMMDHF